MFFSYGITSLGIRMICIVSYGSSNQSALPEMSYQFWIGQSGINTSCEMWWCNRWIWLFIRLIIHSFIWLSLALIIDSTWSCSCCSIFLFLTSLASICHSIVGTTFSCCSIPWSLIVDSIFLFPSLIYRYRT
jgi:hypothetical protein